MFRLIKLAMYAIVGYVLYEIYQGMTEERYGRSSGSSRGGGSRAFDAGGSDGGGEGAVLSGPGVGQSVEVADANGGVIRRTVGRGVVTR